MQDSLEQTEKTSVSVMFVFTSYLKIKKKKIKDTFDPFVRLSLRNDSYIIIHYQGSSSIVLIQSVYV